MWGLGVLGFRISGLGPVYDSGFKSTRVSGLGLTSSYNSPEKEAEGGVICWSRLRDSAHGVAGLLETQKTEA